MSEFEIVPLGSGVNSLRAVALGETFHPVTGPMAEARVLHVDQQQLARRAAEAGSLVVWDVGLGAAANAIAAIEAVSEVGAGLEIHSFDKTTAPLEFGLANAPALGYLDGHQELLGALLRDGKVERAGLSWEFHSGDFRDQLAKPELPSPQAIFYDPYSPATNAEMWTLDHFSRLYRRLDVPCLLSNYTRSTAVRVTLMLAGFFVGTGCGTGEKEETTVAANRLELIERPLDRTWLVRVRNSTNAAPLRTAAYTRGRIDEEDFTRLQSHPQFCG